MPNNRLYPFIAWSIPLFFFAYQFVLRLWPSLIMHQVMENFGVDATSYGVLASVYYYGYAVMQIPIAILLDKYAPRIIMSICALLCGVGMLISVNTDSWIMMLLARFIIGIGSAGGFLSTSKVIAQHFSSEKYGRMISISFSIGLLGAVYGYKPTNELIQLFDLENTGKILAAVAFLIAILGFIILRSQKRSEAIEDLKLSDVLQVIKSPSTIALGLANLLMVGSLEGFADVWGVNYIVAAYRVDKSSAAEIMSFIPIGMIFGGPILVLLSKYVTEYVAIFIAAIGMACSIVYILYFQETFSLVIMAFICFIIGVMCCYQVLIFTIGNSIVSKERLSLTIAFLNCINMLGGAFFHSLIGAGMDFFAGGLITNGVYAISTYKISLFIIPMCSVIGGIITLCLRK